MLNIPLECAWVGHAYETIRKYVAQGFSPAQCGSPKGLHYGENEFSDKLLGVTKALRYKENGTMERNKLTWGRAFRPLNCARRWPRNR